MIKKIQNIMTMVAGSKMALMDHGVFILIKYNISFNPYTTIYVYVLSITVWFKSLLVALRR